MDLPIRNLRCLNILDLPEDVLHEIFDYFQPSAVDIIDLPYTDSSEDAEKFATAQNARLVCRLFHDLASPLLVNALDVHIASESLHRIDMLTRNPKIAAGVRIVQVKVEYRPRELAQSLHLYKMLQWEKLKKMHDSCTYYTEFAFYPTDDEQKILDSMTIIDNMRMAWGIWSGDLDDEDQQTRYNEFLSQCHEEYRHKQEDQYRLLTDGSFVKVLAASMCRLTSLRALAFADYTHCPIDSVYCKTGAEVSAVFANDMEMVRKAFVMPQEWREVENIDPIPELLPAKLLWELPIAIHEGGKELREVKVSTLPVKSNFDMLCPYDQKGDQPAWGRLWRAFRNVQRVYVAGSGRPSQHPPPEKKAYTDKYLAALISSPSMEQVHINFSGFKLSVFESRSNLTPGEKLFDLGSVLASVHWPHIRKLNLYDVSLRQEDLESFFRGMGTKLESVNMCDVAILDGSWKRPLEVLRETLLSAGGSRGRPVDVVLRSLLGGGLESVAYEDYDDDGESCDPYGEEWFDKSNKEEELLDEMAKYIAGVEGMEDVFAKLVLEANPATNGRAMSYKRGLFD